MEHPSHCHPTLLSVEYLHRHRSKDDRAYIENGEVDTDEELARILRGDE